MTPNPAGAVAGAVRKVTGLGGETSGERTLAIFATPEELERFWADDGIVDLVVEGTGVSRSALTMTFSNGRPGWGNEAHLSVELQAPLPELAADTLAGKLLRRFKAIVETGEIPTTDHNPAARG